MSNKSLYERLGGYDAIRAVVNNLLPRLQADSVLARFWQNRGADGIEREKQLLFAAPVNASKATVYGLELDVDWQATEALLLSASYTYLDTEYDDFTSLTKGPGTIADAGNCTIVQDPARLVVGSGVDDDFCRIDLSGNELEYAPKHALVAGYSWRQQLVGDTDWLFEGDMVYQDDRYQDAVNTVEFESYTTVDFRLGLASKQWDVIAYVDNAFEDDSIKSSFRNTYNQGIAFFGGGFSPFGVPSTFVLPGNQTPIKPDQRQIGLRVNYRFNAP